MLPGSAVGSVEFRAIQEPVRTIPGLHHYYQAKARRVDFDNRRLSCEDIFKGKRFQINNYFYQKMPSLGHTFELDYDYLVIAAGMKTNTFGTPGVEEREGKEVFFLKHLYHARQIRNRTIECFERAALPSTSPEERDRLLSFVVVGGGPTSCEFIAELYDFVYHDVAQWYPDLKDHITVSLVEAGEICKLTK